MRTLLIRLALLIAFTVSAFAADLSGKWQGTLKTGDMDLDTTLVFKVDGEKLSGTVTNMYGEEQIAEGVVKGDEISFIVLAGGGQFRLVYKGKVDGEQLKFSVMVADFGTGELIAKRVP